MYSFFVEIRKGKISRLRRLETLSNRLYKHQVAQNTRYWSVKLPTHHKLAVEIMIRTYSMLNGEEESLFRTSRSAAWDMAPSGSHETERNDWVVQYIPCRLLDEGKWSQLQQHNCNCLQLDLCKSTERFRRLRPRILLKCIDKGLYHCVQLGLGIVTST